MAWDALRIGDAVVRFDAEATAAIYATIPAGEADKCACDGCRNYTALRPTIFPDEVLAVLRKLGIDPMKESEPAGIGDEELRIVPPDPAAPDRPTGSNAVRYAGTTPIAYDRTSYSYFDGGFDFVGVVERSTELRFGPMGDHLPRLGGTVLRFEPGVNFPWSAFARSEQAAHIIVMMTRPFVVKPRDDTSAVFLMSYPPPDAT